MNVGLRAGGLLLLAACLPAPAGAVQAGSWHEREMARIEKALLADRESPRAFVELQRAWYLRYGLADDARILALFESVSQDPAARALLRDHAAWDRAALATRANEVTDAERRIAALGFPSDCAVVGPFENLGNAGLAEPFGPEDALLRGSAANVVFEGAEGDVRWRVLTSLGHLGRIDLGGLLVRDEDAAAYVQVAAYVPAGADAALRLGSDDSVRVWLNGRLVHAFEGRREAAFDQEAVAIRLVSGWNRLLVKLAWVGDGGTLYLRITKPEGGPLRGLRWDAAPERFVGPPAKAATPTGSVVAWHPLSAWERSVESAGAAATAEDHGTLGWLRVQFGPDDRALERDAAAFRAAIARASEEPDWQFGLGSALGSDADARRTAYERAARLGAYVPALVALVRHYRSRREPEKARLWADRLERADPTHPRVLLEKVRRWREAGAPVRALALLREARATRPSVPAFHRQEAELLDALEDRRGQADALRRLLLLEANSGTELRKHSRLLAAGLGDPASAIEMRRVLLRFWPWLLSDHMWIARLLAESERQDEALELYDWLERHYPEDPGVPEARGRLLHRLGRLDDALPAMDRALALRPQNKTLRRYLQHLRPGRPSLEDRHAIPLEEVLADGAAAGGPEVGAWTALALEAIRVHDNGLSSKLVQDVVRVESRAQVDAFRTYPIWFVPGREVVEVLLAERVTAGGERHKPSRVATRGPFGKSRGMYTNNRVRRLEFSDLQPGDTLHVRYRVDEVARHNMFGDFFGSIRYLQRSYPRRRVVQIVEMPAGRRLHHGGRGAGEPTRIERDGGVEHRWEWTDLPPLVREPSMPGYPEVARFLSVSTYQDWKEMAAWYARLIRDQFELEDEDRALVRRLTKGLRTTSEKVVALHGWVLANTRYVGIELGIHGFKPYRAARVLRRGYGDCKDKATLLSSMLAEVGVEARLALVRTVDRGLLEPTPATLWAFNHAITYVPELDLWLDGTHEFAGTQELPSRDQGAMALVVGLDGTGELVRTPVLPAAANHWTTRVRAEVREDGSVRVQVRERASGVHAESTRRSFQDASEQRTKLEKILSRRHPGVRVEVVRIEGLDDLERDPVLEFEAVMPGLMEVAGDQASLPLVLYPSNLAERLTPGSEREQDLIIDSPWSEDSEVRLELPAGWSVSKLPDEFSSLSRFGEAAVAAELDGREVVVRGRLAVNARRIPVMQYGGFRSFTRALDRAEGRRIRLVREAR